MSKPHRLSLLKPPNLAEVLVIVDHQGRGYLFNDRPAEEDLQQVAAISAAVIRVGMWFAESHGLVMEQPKEAPLA